MSKSRKQSEVAQFELKSALRVMQSGHAALKALADAIGRSPPHPADIDGWIALATEYGVEDSQCPTQRVLAARILGAARAQARAVTPATQVMVDISEFKSADWFHKNHGIKPARLSEAAGSGRIRIRNAPSGTRDSQGKSVRKLYSWHDAKQHFSLSDKP